MDSHIFSFDVESIGLTGEGYAVGVSLVNLSSRAEVNSFFCHCNPYEASGTHKDFQWVRKNIPDLYGASAVQVERPIILRALFSRYWIQMRQNYSNVVMVCDCPWPVESRFLLDCVRETPSMDMPYPILDVASIRYAKGLDPNEVCPRLPIELPVHNPLADARQSARLFIEAMLEGT